MCVTGVADKAIRTRENCICLNSTLIRFKPPKPQDISEVSAKQRTSTMNQADTQIETHPNLKRQAAQRPGEDILCKATMTK